MAKGRPRAFDKDQALDQALGVFLRQGYEGASLADLTTAMGINPPSLYAAFGNKEGLFRQALDRYTDENGQHFSQALSEPLVKDGVRRLLLGTAERSTDPKRPPGCLLVHGALACGEDADPVKRELASRRGATEDLLRDRFKQAIAEGDLPADADATGLARYVVTVIQGMAVQAAGGATRAALRQVAETAMMAWPEGRTGGAKARRR